ncbi:unnamed protein product [Oncorhynchus mykiss]|uniref:P2X purinoceptor n=1 Tax=Oncorhynchus mykiss TaxID=8022 RepID=A0A060Y1Z9_ONCMY|nr:unnamed protein product [Oncorhynchus mykiss]
MGLLQFIKDYFIGFLDYETPKVMVVKNKKLGVIYRGVQFFVITYFIWYVFISQKAYQDSETRPENSVYTKMKGTALQGDHVLDMVEYVRPSEGGDVISTILRRVVTHNQRQGTCAEHFTVPNANCSKDSDCISGKVDFDGNGQRTGRCVPYYNQTFKTCEIQTWCPIEDYAAIREPALAEAINFTVYIKNAIHFPKFKVLRGNIKPNKRNGQKYLNKCHYNEEKHPTAPSSGWVTSQNRPGRSSASFAGLFAKYYSKDGEEFRTLIKAFGIRLDVIVHGNAGRFSIIPTIINTVTAMTSVGICSIICDWIMLTFIDKNDIYSGRKFDDDSKVPKPSQTFTLPTEFTIISYGSTHSDLSEGVAL